MFDNLKMAGENKMDFSCNGLLLFIKAKGEEKPEKGGGGVMDDKVSKGSSHEKNIRYVFGIHGTFDPTCRTFR